MAKELWQREYQRQAGYPSRQRKLRIVGLKKIIDGAPPASATPCRRQLQGCEMFSTSGADIREQQ